MFGLDKNEEKEAQVSIDATLHVLLLRMTFQSSSETMADLYVHRFRADASGGHHWWRSERFDMHQMLSGRRSRAHLLRNDQ